MCQWNDTVKLRVKISARKSYTGQERWDIKPVDRCIAPIVQALNDAGIYTEECCCGHGKSDGYLGLIDGRMFIIPQNGQADWNWYRDIVTDRPQNLTIFQRIKRILKLVVRLVLWEVRQS